MSPFKQNDDISHGSGHICMLDTSLMYQNMVNLKCRECQCELNVKAEKVLNEIVILEFLI